MMETCVFASLSLGQLHHEHSLNTVNKLQKMTGATLNRNSCYSNLFSYFKIK